MKRVTIKAEQAGRYGLKVGNKEAIIVQNHGGMPGFLSEQATVRGLSNEDAVRRGAAKAGLDPEECVLDYLAAIGRKGGQAGRGEAKRRGVVVDLSRAAMVALAGKDGIRRGRVTQEAT